MHTQMNFDKAVSGENVPAILMHEWGKSLSVDRVWAGVSGISPRKAGMRLFMVLQAYIDDSYKKDGVFVLGGYVSTAEKWANFTAEWEDLLKQGFGAVTKNGVRHFKASAMHSERLRDQVPFFKRVAEKHAIVALSASIKIPDLRRAIARLSISNTPIEWEFLANNFTVCFMILLDMFQQNREQFPSAFPVDEPIDFIFDNQEGEKGAIMAGWNVFLEARPEKFRKRYGATPRFEDDQIFLPLQAADFWAWHVRKWIEEGSLDRNLDSLEEKMPSIFISYDENMIVETLKLYLRNAANGRPVYDVTCGPFDQLSHLLRS